MKTTLIFSLLFISSFVTGQSLIVDELMTIDPSSTWPFTWDIEVTESNIIYVGNELGKVYFKEQGGDWTELELPESAGADVRRVKVDKEDRIWIATDGSGVHMLDGDIWTSYTTENSNISSNNFRHFEVSKTGKVYGGDDQGLNIWSNGTWSVRNSANSIMESDYIDVMGVNPVTGKVYFGDNSLLYTVFSSSVQSKIDLDDSFGWNTRINALYPDGSEMLIGTEKGLLSLSATQITDLRAISGDDIVSDVAIDSKGNIWLSKTFYGLSIYDGEVLHKIGSSDTLPSQIFDMAPFNDNVLLVGNRGARLASTYWKDAISTVNSLELGGLTASPKITTGSILLSFDDQINIDYTCYIYSRDGILMNSVISNNDLDVSSFAAGTYYLRIRNNSNKKFYETQKIIKI